MLYGHKTLCRLDWIVQCLTSPPTQYRLYGRSKDPTKTLWELCIEWPTSDQVDSPNMWALLAEFTMYLWLGIVGSVGSHLLDHLHLHQYKSSTTLLDMHHLSSFRYASPHLWNQLPSSFHLILFTLLLVHIRPKTKWAVLKYISPATILNFYDICLSVHLSHAQHRKVLQISFYIRWVVQGQKVKGKGRQKS